MVLLVARQTRTCIICGAENMSCQQGDAPRTEVVRDTDYEVRSDGRVIIDARHRHRLIEGRWVSTREELVQLDDEKFERRYAAGDFVPLLVALSQGQVRRRQLTDGDKAELKRHLKDDVITIEQLREALVAGGE